MMSPAAKKKILIADDDIVFNDVLVNFLRKEGFQVETARDGMMASQAAMRAPHPALIFLDIRMPAGSGIDVLKRLRLSTKTAHIPIIAVSADPSPTLPEQALAAGATEFVLKPINLEEIRKLMAEILE